VSNHIVPLVGEEGAVAPTAIDLESTYSLVAAWLFDVGVATSTVPPKEPPFATMSPFFTLKSFSTVAIYYSFFQLFLFFIKLEVFRQQ
jgi:hypothetical protein